MNGYSVDGDDLRHAEHRIRDLAREFADSAGLRYAIAVREVGNTELAQALGEFDDQSRLVAGTLCDVAADAADRLHDTGVYYADRDRATADTIAGQE